MQNLQKQEEGSLNLVLQVPGSTPEKAAVMREGDPRNDATSCLLMCPAATLRSVAANRHVKEGGLVPPVNHANRPCRDR